MFDFCSYKLCDAVEDEHGITLFLTCTRKTGDCPECGKRCSFIEDRYTRTIRDLDLCPQMNLTDAADVAKINWKTAKRIDKKYLNRLVIGLDAICPTKLGVDEIAYRKGHNYLTHGGARPEHRQSHLDWSNAQKDGARCVLQITWSTKMLSDTGLRDGYVGAVYRFCT